MESVANGSESDEFRAIESSCSARIRGHRRSKHESPEFKSKNLHAERRRRQKLSDRLLTLRATVPIITNMNKATIIDDAITYIQQLQTTVDVLKDELVELEASPGEVILPRNPRDLQKRHIQADVKVTQIDEQRLWIKVLFAKRKGAFAELIQALSSFGFELIDTSVTTLEGGVLVTSILNGIFCSSKPEQTRDLLLEIVGGFERGCSV